MHIKFQNIYSNYKSVKQVAQKGQNLTMVKQEAYPKLTYSTNFRGLDSNIFQQKTLKRTADLSQLSMFNPSGENLYRKINQFLPQNCDVNLLALATIITPFSDASLDEIIVSKFFDLYNFANENNIKRDVNVIAEFVLKSFDINKRKNEVKFLPKVMDFIKSNLNDEDLGKVLKLCLNEDKDGIELSKLELFRNFKTVDILPLDLERVLRTKYSTDSEYWNNFQRSMNLTTAIDEAVTLTNLAYEKELSMDYLEELYTKALARKEKLETFDCKITDEDVKTLLFSNARKTLNTIEFLGEKAFLYSFVEKYDKVKENIKVYGDIQHKLYYEDILEIINPRNSRKYKDAIKNIAELKQGFNAKTPEERKIAIDGINKNNLIIKELLSKEKTDPQDILKTATIYKTLWRKDPDYLVDVLPYLGYRNEEEKAMLYKKLNEIVLKSMGISLKMNPVMSKKINFAESKYLPSLFDTDFGFNKGLRSILNFLSAYPELTVAEVFNLLLQNVRTKELFEKNGLDYNKWVDFDPKSILEISVQIDMEKTMREAINNLEADFNHLAFAYLPHYIINNLEESLNKGGFLLQNDPLLENSARKLYKKNGKPVEYKDLKSIIDITVAEMTTKEFWTKTQQSSEIENAKQVLKNIFLRERKYEIKKLIKNNQGRNEQKILTVQKADMNDINKSLFLGNDAGCCVAVGHNRDWTAPYYVMNKMFSCIEVKDGQQGIGNSICFIAIVDGAPALILDNIEIRSEYRYNDAIKNGIFEYAQKICAEVGKPDMPIYIASKRNRLHLDELEREKKDVQILGSTGYTEVYLDFDVESHKLSGEEKFNILLYKMR